MTSGKRLVARVAPYARFVRGIAHPHRLAILYLLAHAPMFPHEIGKHIPVPESLVAHHIKAMYASGWLKKQRVGKHMLYSVNKKTLREIPKFLLDTPLWRNMSKKPV